MELTELEKELKKYIRFNRSKGESWGDTYFELCKTIQDLMTDVEKDEAFSKSIKRYTK